MGVDRQGPPLRGGHLIVSEMRCYFFSSFEVIHGFNIPWGEILWDASLISGHPRGRCSEITTETALPHWTLVF